MKRKNMIIDDGEFKTYITIRNGLCAEIEQTMNDEKQDRILLSSEELREILNKMDEVK